MPIFRFRPLAVLLALLGLMVPRVEAQTKTITALFDLNAFSTYIKTYPERNLVAYIDNYTNPGTLTIDRPYGNLDTLTLRRSDPDSDGVISVDSTFIDVKNFSGTLILKGLSFRLHSKSAFMAGFDLNHPNHNLIIDSCFFYADTLDGTFLSWQSDAEAQVTISNSWFVARTSTTGAANLQLTAGRVMLSNNLFNFAGIVTGASILQEIKIVSNTFNRTQVKLNGDPYKSNLPTYSFTRNLFAFRGPINAFGGDKYFAIKAIGFDEVPSLISANRMYSGWAGFDWPNGTKGASTSQPDSTVDKKTAGELWNWYTDSSDASTGLLSGTSKRVRYNVLPTKSQFDTTLSSGKTLSVSFTPVTFPRNFGITIGSPPGLDSAYRMRESLQGTLHFGPFRVQALTLGDRPAYGKPVLLAQQGTNGSFQRQASTSTPDDGSSIYVNQSPGARVFIAVDSGNTWRGTNVVPVAGTSFAKDEHLRFAKVDASGRTRAQDSAIGSMPDSLRYLQRQFGFTTSATMNSTMTFASKPVLQPWVAKEDNALFWYVPDQNAFLPATRGSLWGDSLYTGATPFATGTSRQTSFKAYLVEKLSIHAGDKFRKPLPGGDTLLSYSKAGYQIHVDTFPVDTSHYGSASLRYQFHSTGRGPTDSLFLLMKPVPGGDVFKMDSAGTQSLSMKIDSSGYYRIPIFPGDSLLSFFVGIRFNVIANVPFQGWIDGAFIDSLKSTTSGNLTFRSQTLSQAQSTGSNKEDVFRNTRFLGGRIIGNSRLKIQGPYRAKFAIEHFQDSLNVETWYLAHGTWARLDSASGGGRVSDDTARVEVPDSATQLVVVERYQSMDSYFASNEILSPAKDSLIFSLVQKPNEPNSPVVGYCLEIHYIDRIGQIKDLPCERKATDQPTRIKLNENMAYTYRVVYFVGPDAVQLPQGITYSDKLGWDARKILEQLTTFKPVDQGHWRLVGMPVEERLGKMLRHLSRVPDTTVKIAKDTILVMKLSDTGQGQAKFDSLKIKDAIALPGQGYLIAASHPMELNFDSLTNLVRSPKPVTTVVPAGWSLIGNPFPINLSQNCLKRRSTTPLLIRELKYDSIRKYSWDSLETKLKPFSGYALYSSSADTLTFDPNDTTAPAPAQAKSAAPAGRVSVSLEGTLGRSSMAFIKGPADYAVPFLPTPAAGLEMRVGGKGGYWIKPVQDLAGIDQPVEISAAETGTAAFTLDATAPGTSFALIDEATGAVYDAAAVKELPVQAGTSTYRLLAGDAAFVQAKAQAFRAAAPTALSLSQNFPNPVHGLTRIALEWPATQANDRRAFLEILDMQGRRIGMRRIDGIRVGRQLIDLDATAWKSGLYIYRLTVIAGGQVSRLQKRMLVAP